MGHKLFKRKLKYVMCLIAVMLFTLIPTSCSVTSQDISVENISIENNVLKADVVLKNIDRENFAKTGDNGTLRTVTIYYTYSEEKVAAMRADTTYVGHQRTGTDETGNLPQSEYDGSYSYSVPVEDVLAFKEGTDTTATIPIETNLELDPSVSRVYFTARLSGFDRNDTSNLTGWIYSNMFAYDVNPISIQVDLGKGHGVLFDQDTLDYIKSEFEISDITIDGDILTITGIDPEYTEYEFGEDVSEGLWYIISDKLENLVHNNERYADVLYKPLDSYDTYEDLLDDMEARRDTKIVDGTKLYAAWLKPFQKLEIDNSKPTCGKTSYEALPEIPEGIVFYDEGNPWTDKNGEEVGTFTGGEEYTFDYTYQLSRYGALWKYYLDLDNFNISIKDGEDAGTRVYKNYIEVKYTATAEHDWDGGIVEKEPTKTEDGEMFYICNNYEYCQGTKTEIIPRLKANDAIAAKGIASGKNAIKISWNKVEDADKYAIYFSKCNTKDKEYTCKKIKTVKAGTLSYTKAKLNKNTSYKFYVEAIDKDGKTISKSLKGHTYTGNVKGKYTNAKSVKVSKSSYTLDKDASATIKASVVKVKSGKKLSTHVNKLRYTSSDKAIAKVSSNGKITAVGSGDATIYVQAANGIWATCKVTVKAPK